MFNSNPILFWFIVAAWISGVTAKISSYLRSRRQFTFKEFSFQSPVLSITSHLKKRTATSNDFRSSFFETFLLFGFAYLSRATYFKYALPTSPTAYQQAYLAIIPLYLFGQFMSAFTTLIYLPTGFYFPQHFQYPFLSTSLAEFWGHRWASWVADWFRQMVLNRHKRHPVLGLFLVFIYSGIWHEILLNIPLFIFYKVNLVGSWILYFLFQATGVALENKLKLKNRFLKWAMAWFFILAPLPLAINEAAIRAFGLFK